MRRALSLRPVLRVPPRLLSQAGVPLLRDQRQHLCMLHQVGISQKGGGAHPDIPHNQHKKQIRNHIKAGHLNPYLDGWKSRDELWN